MSFIKWWIMPSIILGKSRDRHRLNEVPNPIPRWESTGQHNIARQYTYNIYPPHSPLSPHWAHWGSRSISHGYTKDILRTASRSVSSSPSGNHLGFPSYLSNPVCSGYRSITTHTTTQPIADRQADSSFFICHYHSISCPLHSTIASSINLIVIA